MGWKSEVHGMLGRAVERGDLSEFRRLLAEYPDNLRYRDGRDYYLSCAISVGRLEFVKFLIEDMRIGPDEKRFMTPLMLAMTHGHRDIAIWLLDHGASVNETFGEMIDSPALKFAAAEGDLAMVKILVEHGADVNAAGTHAVNAYMMADDLQVKKYLKSVGGRNLNELHPPDFPGSHARIVTEMEDHVEQNQKWGRLIDWRMDFPGDPVIRFQARTASLRGKTRLLFTVGVSDVLLVDHEVGFGYGVELITYLPKKWRLEVATNSDPQWNWPMVALEKLARQIIANGSLHLDGSAERGRVATEWNCDPPEPIRWDTKLCGWLLLASGNVPMPDYRQVQFLSVVPLYKEEVEFVRERSDDQVLLKRFEWLNIPREWDLNRPNAVADWSEDWPDLDEESCGV
jgi:hypothetical protein